MKIVLCLAILVVVVNGQRRPSPKDEAGQTECQRKRTQAQDKLIVGGLVPECEANGEYKSLQCHPENTRGKRFCQCWRTDGTPITQPSTKLKNCSCIRSKNEAQSDNKPPVLGRYDPQCKEDGSYENKQCHGSTGMCWCVDNDGNKLTEPARGSINCEAKIPK